MDRNFHYVRILYSSCLRITSTSPMVSMNSDLFLAFLLGFGDGFDDTDGNGLTHVTDGETTKRGVVSESLNAQWLGGLKVDNARITRLDELGVLFKNLTGTTVHLLLDMSELAGDVGSVAVKNRGVSVTDLTGVVHDNDLSLEAADTGGGVGLGVRGNETTLEILDGNVLHVETNVVTRDGLGERFVVHLNGLDFSNNTSGGEHSMDTRLDYTSFDTAYGDSSDTTNLVHILKGEAERLVGGSLGRVDAVEGLK